MQQKALLNCFYFVTNGQFPLEQPVCVGKNMLNNFLFGFEA